jgi:hypothetical protein
MRVTLPRYPDLETRSSPGAVALTTGPRAGLSDDSSAGLRATGYAIVFDSETVIADEFRELVRPEAVTRHLATGPDIKVCWNHEPDNVLGTTRSGTARLTVDARGVRFDAELDPDDPTAQAARQKLVRGKITGSSFTFRVRRELWHPPATRGGLPLREITDLDLFECGPVTWPAYPSTSAHARTTSPATTTPTPKAAVVNARERARLAAAEAQLASLRRK